MSGSAQEAMAKLVPKNPSDVTVVRAVTDNILTFSAPFKRGGFIKIGGRGTVGAFNYPMHLLAQPRRS